MNLHYQQMLSKYAERMQEIECNFVAHLGNLITVDCVNCDKTVCLPCSTIRRTTEKNIFHFCNRCDNLSKSSIKFEKEMNKNITIKSLVTDIHTLATSSLPINKVTLSELMSTIEYVSLPPDTHQEA